MGYTVCEDPGTSTTVCHGLQTRLHLVLPTHPLVPPTSDPLSCLCRAVPNGSVCTYMCAGTVHRCVAGWLQVVAASVILRSVSGVGRRGSNSQESPSATAQDSLLLTQSVSDEKERLGLKLTVPTTGSKSSSIFASAVDREVSALGTMPWWSRG